VLASSSPRRRELLAEFGYRFETVVADVVEVAPPHLSVAETTLFNAKAKASAVARLRPESVTVGADTLVALAGEPLGKPRDADDAFAMLTRLSGQEHEVFSGVWITHAASGRARGFIEVARVCFRKLEPSEIREYMQRIHVLDKAGAYAAQEDPMHIIRSISGSRTNVIGLPMEALAQALDAGWNA
jgi:septum formation protein